MVRSLAEIQADLEKAKIPRADRDEIVKDKVAAIQGRRTWDDVTIEDLNKVEGMFTGTEAAAFSRLKVGREKGAELTTRVAAFEDTHQRWVAAGRPASHLVENGDQIQLIEYEEREVVR